MSEIRFVPRKEMDTRNMSNEILHLKEMKLVLDFILGLVRNTSMSAEQIAECIDRLNGFLDARIEYEEENRNTIERPNSRWV